MARSDDDIVVFFDIGGVLLRFTPFTAARRMARAAGLGALAAARALWSWELVERVERGETTPEQVHRQFCLHAGWKGSFEEFARLWNGQWALKTRSAALLERLASRRRVFLLSNTNALHWEHIRSRYAFARKVEGAVLSYELGCRKPEPRIFKAALKAAKVPAARCLLIDDRAENVAAARKAGFQALLYRDSRTLSADLKKLGLL